MNKFKTLPNHAHPFLIVVAHGDFIRQRGATYRMSDSKRPNMQLDSLCELVTTEPVEHV